ncbi:hypothetical protein [Alicycliphilus denitrificans]|uniref:hypothetical protein n=1 Tax=Alicycliphilus denitrificans TaxID=179636 RepID=UPI000C9FA0F9|nr:hypothetical protein [Alicycliphilus denitrificans]
MDRRQKDITTMAEHADLAVVSCEKKNSRQYATLLAENGVKRTFSISMGSRSDPRGDLNELGAMKRFSRENRIPAAPQAQPLPSAPETTPQPMTMTAAATKKTMTIPATKKAAVQSLSHVDFYRVCEWVKAQNLATVPNLEALAMLAGQWLQSAVPEEEMKLVMDTIGVREPPHWAEPTNPQAILARELLTVMKKLGEEPSTAFKRLADSLLPA